MRLTIFQDHTIDSQEVLERQKKSKNSLIFYNTPTVTEEEVSELIAKKIDIFLLGDNKTNKKISPFVRSFLKNGYPPDSISFVNKDPDHILNLKDSILFGEPVSSRSYVIFSGDYPEYKPIINFFNKNNIRYGYALDRNTRFDSLYPVDKASNYTPTGWVASDCLSQPYEDWDQVCLVVGCNSPNPLIRYCRTASYVIFCTLAKQGLLKDYSNWQVRVNEYNKVKGECTWLENRWYLVVACIGKYILISPDYINDRFLCPF